MKKLTKLPSYIINNNKALMVASLIAAFIVWFAMSQYYNPVNTRTIKDVPINFDISDTAVANLGLDVVHYDTDSVSVVISGKTADLSSVEASDIVITPTLSAVTEAGTYEITLVPSKTKLFSDFEIVSVTPQKINVTFDELITRTFDVSAEAVGCTTSGSLVPEVPVMTESATRTLNVSGAKTDVERIASVVARAQVNKELTETSTFDADIVLLDSDGNEIDSSFMNLGFRTANITVAVSMTKTLPIKPVFSNKPDAVDFRYSLSESKITVIGKPEIINEMTRVNLREIDCGLITAGNKTFDREFDLPSGVRVYDSSVSSVTVTLHTDSYISKTLRVTNVSFTGVDSSRSARLKSGISITVMGSKKEIAALTAADLTLNVNLSGETAAGDYEKTATVTVSSNFKTVWVVTLDKTYNVVVTLT